MAISVAHAAHRLKMALPARFSDTEPVTCTGCVVGVLVVVLESQTMVSRPLGALDLWNIHFFPMP